MEPRTHCIPAQCDIETAAAERPQDEHRSESNHERAGIVDEVLRVRRVRGEAVERAWREKCPGAKPAG